MKKLRIFLSMGLLGLITACGTTQSSTADTQITNRGRSNTEIASTRNSTTNTRQATRTTRATTSTRQATTETSEATTATTANRTNVVNDEARMQKMYSDLEMAQDQRSRFEREWKNASERWKKSNRNKTMNSYERTEYQDQILKDILTEQQFQNYQKWARENASTRD
ncbi:MAG TPA: hypothetical protein VFM72_06370 [Aequorivita sp.]|nr:hypothetical protein [Aequorivita sp.]